MAPLIKGKVREVAIGDIIDSPHMLPVRIMAGDLEQMVEALAFKADNDRVKQDLRSRICQKSAALADGFESAGVEKRKEID
jgi:hypothetical protein